MRIRITSTVEPGVVERPDGTLDWSGADVREFSENDSPPPPTRAMALLHSWWDLLLVAARTGDESDDYAAERAHLSLAMEMNAAARRSAPSVPEVRRAD